MKILATGLSGLVGSRIKELLPSYTFEEISRKTGVDITNQSQVKAAIQAFEGEYILHLAAKTDVDGCEMDKALGKNGEAWKINVEGTRYVVEAAAEKNIPVIYISTEFVFGGTKPVGQAYAEDDDPEPINWYAQTKYEAERIVHQYDSSLILRIAYPYRALFEKKDFVRAILSRLTNGQEVQAITDHVMTPTYIDDIPSALEFLIQRKSRGIYHVVGSQSLSPYEAAIAIADTFHCDQSLIQQTTRADYFQNRAARPFNLAISNAKITEQGITMRTFEEGLRYIKTQMRGESDL